jgi:hypothetical protein
VQLRYRVKSCREVGFEFIQEGYGVIRKYSQIGFGRGLSTTGAYCFDDLGCESRQKHYGNDCNVMGEILLSRYDLFVTGGLKTFLTTNLTSSEVEGSYGSRVRSRLREMLNLVSFEKDAKDKRV